MYNERTFLGLKLCWLTSRWETIMEIISKLSINLKQIKIWIYARIYYCSISRHTTSEQRCYNVVLTFRCLYNVHTNVLSRQGSLTFGKYIKVGKPGTFKSSISLAVPSILAITILSSSLYVSPSFSQVGANSLQCPHHGASRKIEQDTTKSSKISQYTLSDKIFRRTKVTKFFGGDENLVRRKIFFWKTFFCPIRL